VKFIEVSIRQLFMSITYSVSFQHNVLFFSIVISAILALLFMTFMTVEYDEAWIIASARQAFDPAAVPQVPQVMTTGGLHFLLLGFAQTFGVDPMLSARAVSFFCVVLLFVLIYRRVGDWCHSRVEKLIIVATCCAAPGTIAMAGMGYGVSLALLLFLAGLVTLVRDPQITLRSALLGGVLIGMALATRWTFLPALPVIALVAFQSRPHLKTNLIHVVIAGATAVALFVGFFALQSTMLEGTGPVEALSLAERTAGNASAAGLTTHLPNPARTLAFLARFSAMLPISLIMITFLAYLALREDDRARRMLLVFIGVAVLITVGWVLRSPFMHLRYIWPAYLFISLSAGLGLAYLYRKSHEQNVPSVQAFAALMPVGLVFVQAVLMLRLVAVGAGMQVNAGGYDNLENHYKPFYLHSEERAIARYLAESAPGAVFGTLTLPDEQGAIELALLGQREIIDFRRANDVETRPDFMITHRFSGLNQTGDAWYSTLGEPVATVGGYTVYALPTATDIPNINSVLLPNELYRFTLTKVVSLTGW
jgi:hypothetical protein